MIMKRWIIAIVALIFIGYGVKTYIYKPHKNIAEQKEDLIISGVTLLDEYAGDQKMGDEKYLDKIILVYGTVTNVSGQLLTIDGSIIAQFESSISESGKAIKFKGRCLGYDELLGEIRFDQCIIIKE